MWRPTFANVNINHKLKSTVMKNNQNNPLQSANANQKNNDTARNIALAAGAMVGSAGAGGMAGYAATMLNDSETETEEVVAEEVVAEPAPVQEPEPEPVVVERVVVREVPAEQEEEEVVNTYDLDNAEVEVLQVGQTEDGGYYAAASVDNHAAAFVDVDGDGAVDALGVDLNDNMELENGEVFDVSDRNIGMHDLAMAAQQEEPVGHEPVVNPGSTPTPDELDPTQVQVEEVATDVDMEGHQVNLASVSYNGHAGMAVDADQDGDAEMVAIDMNDNTEFEDNEYYTAGDGALMMEPGGNSNVVEPEPLPEPMPEPEPEYFDDPTTEGDGLPDYTNNGDIDGYVI